MWRSSELGAERAGESAMGTVTLLGAPASHTQEETGSSQGLDPAPAPLRVQPSRGASWGREPERVQKLTRYSGGTGAAHSGHSTPAGLQACSC